ncbi:MAG TPA: hypothetical protein VLS92_11480 [Acidimicrobiia bacterium]|nr:hypothetical protein [Acidimicrobiia bacterium]
MAEEERPVLRQLTELWDAAWSRVVEGPVEGLEEVIARFEEEVTACLADAVQGGDPGAVARACADWGEWDERVSSQVMRYGLDGPQQEIAQALSREEAATDRCFEEAKRRGLTYDKVRAYGTPGDPYAFTAYAQDHPEDPVASALLRCLEAIETESREGAQGFERRKAAVGELHAATGRAQSRVGQQLVPAAARRPDPGEGSTGEGADRAGRLEQPPFDETEFLGWRIRNHLAQASQKGSVPPGMQLFQKTFTMTRAELVALARELGIDPDAASDADVARYLLSSAATATVQRVTNSPEIREWQAALQRGEMAPPPPSYARVQGLASLPGRITVGISDREALDLLREHGLSLPVRAEEPACSLCGSIVPLGEAGLCSSCRAVVAAWQGAGEGTEQGWAIDPDTVIPWDLLAAHIAALAAHLAALAESPAEPSEWKPDPALEEFIQRLIEALREVARVVRLVVEGGEPPTVEVIERIKMPFAQAFGPSGGPAYATAAFGHFATTNPGAWAPDPGRDFEEGMSDAARSALESFLPEGFLDKLDDWRRRLGIGSEKEIPEGSTYDPESAKYPISLPGDPDWYCKYCGKRLAGMGEICRSCNAQERPWCRHCDWPRSAHSGERLFCPPRPRPAR